MKNIKDETVNCIVKLLRIVHLNIYFTKINNNFNENHGYDYIIRTLSIFIINDK